MTFQAAQLAPHRVIRSGFLFMFLLALCCLYSLNANSEDVKSSKNETQTLDLPTMKIESATDPRIKQAYQIIDDIKKRNPPDNFKIEVRSGLLQIFANSTDSIDLNRYKSLHFMGIDASAMFSEKWGLEARTYYAKNYLFPTESGSPNGPNAYLATTEGGLRYRMILDAAQIDDYVVLRLLYHSQVNNFKLRETTGVFVKSYSGIVAGIERSIPVTPKIGILANLDLNMIQSAKTDSDAEIVSTGVGFQMRGSMYYEVNWLGTVSRLGAAYWQGGLVNRFSPASQQNTGKTSHVQTFRAVSMSLAMFY